MLCNTGRHWTSVLVDTMRRFWTSILFSWCNKMSLNLRAVWCNKTPLYFPHNLTFGDPATRENIEFEFGDWAGHLHGDPATRGNIELEFGDWAGHLHGDPVTRGNIELEFGDWVGLLHGIQWREGTLNLSLGIGWGIYMGGSSDVREHWIWGLGGASTWGSSDVREHWIWIWGLGEASTWGSKDAKKHWASLFYFNAPPPSLWRDGGGGIYKGIQRQRDPVTRWNVKLAMWGGDEVEMTLPGSSYTRSSDTRVHWACSVCVWGAGGGEYSGIQWH